MKHTKYIKSLKNKKLSTVLFQPRPLGSLKYHAPSLNTQEESDFLSEPELGFSCSSVVMNQYTVHLNQPVLTPSYYNNIIDLFMNTTENDTIVFLVSSPGGRADGLLYLLEGVRMTDAHTVAVLIGEVASSASIFSLHCNEVQVTPFSTMLCHNASFGSGGKVQDVISHVQHVAKNTEKLMRSTYEGFLSEVEIQEMLAGKEIYLDTEMIEERLIKKNEYLVAKVELEQLEQLEANTEDVYAEDVEGLDYDKEFYGDVEEVDQEYMQLLEKQIKSPKRSRPKKMPELDENGKLV